MKALKTISFLRELSMNNNRDWFHAHKAEYQEAREDFELGVSELLREIAKFDSSISQLEVKDCMYRVNRDIRFSQDKSPYKTHIGAYIAAHGKKSLHGGYYIHIEPGNCMVACGNYYLPTNVLNACRWEIINNQERFGEAIGTKGFKKYFGGNIGNCGSLKTAPKGFPKDAPYMEYLRLKDYCCWHYVDDDFYEGDSWLPETVRMFKSAKPFMDFFNAVIDDYE